jgi:hypothetical protein
VRTALPGAAAPAPWHVAGPTHPLSRRHNLDERDRPMKRRFDRMDEVRISWINGSTCPADQPPQASFQGNPRVPERRRFITWLRVGSTAPRGPAASPTAIPVETDPRNRPSTASVAVIRSVQVERLWIIGSAAPPHLAALVKMGPHAQPTSLAYKRNLTLAGMDTQCWSISFPLFCLLRVGLV